jgi:hypothetical protein
MSEEKKGKVLQVFRLETEAVVSVLDLDERVHIGPVSFIPLSDKSRLNLAFKSAGLTSDQVKYALDKLKRTAKDDGFPIRIDQSHLLSI